MENSAFVVRNVQNKQAQSVENLQTFWCYSSYHVAQIIGEVADVI